MPALFKMRWFNLVAGLALALLVFVLPAGLPSEQRIMAAIFMLALYYWVREPIPLYATGLLAALASAVLLGPLAHLHGRTALDYRIFLNPFASPVVILLLGGFVMARVFSKHNLDLEFCRFLLKRLGSRPGVVLLGMMAITAGMSMWMSNTATTAIMVATVLPLVRKLPPDSNLVRALMLGVPFAANIGGLATPIGTPPNAIAIGLLADQGLEVSFLSWLLAGFPLALGLLGITYLLLRASFPIRRQRFEIRLGEPPETAHRGLIYSVTVITVLLWVSDQWHGIPAALIALVPVIAFSAFGLLTRRQLREVAWDILLLIGGGIALGVGIRQTGLADTLAGVLLPGGLPPLLTEVILCTLVALLATFISNTAAGNIILPLALSAATAFPGRSAIAVALCASMGMALPISTPPNAIAYGSDMIRSRDMLRVGVAVTLLGIILVIAYQGLLYRLLPALHAGIPH